MRNVGSSTELHPKILDPVIDEIIRTFDILQNTDGSWGIQEKELARGHTTSWVLKALSVLGEQESLKNGINYFRDMLNKLEFDPIKNFSKLDESFIKGVFNCTDFLIEDKRIDKKKLGKFYTDLLVQLEKKNWLSSLPVAAYVVFGLKNHNFAKEKVENAREYIEKELKIRGDTLQSLTPDICLAVPEKLSSIVSDENFVTNAVRLPDLNLIHILISLFLLKKENNTLTNQLRSNILERLRKRQFTEIDKKITKEFLDLALLIRSGHRGDSLESKLKKQSSMISLKSETSENGTFNIELKKMTESFEHMQLISLASYVYALGLSNDEYVHILGPQEYNSVKSFFLENTIPVPKKAEAIFEIITIAVVFIFIILIFFYISTLFPEGYWINTFSAFAIGIFTFLLIKLNLIRKFPYIDGVIKKLHSGGDKHPR